jgi:type VI secretion system secreted protein Hcp
MAIYMKYDGIDGSVTAKGYEKWIELQSCQVALHRNIISPTGRGGNREAAVPAVNEIPITKHQDCSTSSLFRASLWGEGKKVKIDFVKTDQTKFEPYLQLELENTLISSFVSSGHGGDGHERPIESLSLNFTKIMINTIHMDDKNKTGKPDRVMWDLSAGKGA